MGNYNFKEDLKVAKKTEQEVAEILHKKYEMEILDFGKNSNYDIHGKIGNTEITFEVKEDFICETTNNVGVEFECRGKASGIQTTKSNFYIYKLHTKNGIEYIMHPISKLKKMIEDKKYFRIVNGGDKGSNSMFYLFTYGAFVKDGTKIAP